MIDIEVLMNPHLSPAEPIKRDVSGVERQMRAFYNQSGVYRDLLASHDVFRLDVALAEYVSLVSRYAGNERILLDLGCGTGRTTFQLTSRGCRVVGMDISSLFLSQQQAGATSDRARFVIGDIVRLPFRDHSVSCVGLHNVIEHVPDTDGLLSEIVRVLRDDGTVVIVSPNLLSPVRPVRHLLGIEGFDTRFYGSAWKALTAIFGNVALLFRKIVATRAVFTYREPLLGDDFRCPDDDAVYLANVVDLTKWFTNRGFTATYMQFRPQENKISGRLKSRVLHWLPWLDKGFCLIVQPVRSSELAQRTPSVKAIHSFDAVRESR